MKKIASILIPLSVLVLMSCKLPANNKTNTDAKDSLTTLYTKAINEYIGIIRNRDNVKFDTLFISNRKLGQPDDFPDINLPSTINNTHIELIPMLNGNENQKYIFSKTSPMINLIGCVEQTKAEFIFVTFYPGFKHQFDCYINYTLNTNSKTFELENARVEVIK